MFVELRTYTVASGQIPHYFELYEAEGLAIHSRAVGNLIGVFAAEIGPLNQITYMMGYDSLDERMERRARLAADPAWQAYARKVRPLITHQECRILRPASFSPMR